MSYATGEKQTGGQTERPKDADYVDDLRRVTCALGPFTIDVLVDREGRFRGVARVSVDPRAIDSSGHRHTSFDDIERYYGIPEASSPQDRMFYREGRGDQLRFGDVVSGFPSAHAVIEAPGTDEPCTAEVRLDLSKEMAVVLTPCCEVGKSDHLTLAPLASISRWPYPLKNEHFRTDPLRLNALVEPENCVPKSEWGQMTESERNLRIAGGRTYAFNYLFAYPNKSPVLADDAFVVDLGRGRESINAEVHVVDFRDVYRVSIVKNRHKEFVDRKKLELTPQTRELLRLKLSYFFGHPVKEDSELITAEASRIDEVSDTPSR